MSVGMSGVDSLRSVFAEVKKPVCTAFITLGFPSLDSSLAIAQALVAAGVQIIEIGVPFSDSLVDGEVIQRANTIALANGMNLERYFAQVELIRSEVDVPLVLMGALNPLLAYGFDNALDRCKETGISGLIIPELPPEEFEEKHQQSFADRGLAYIPLITSRTTLDRVRWLDSLASGFLYLVSGVGTTGGGLSTSISTSEELQAILGLDLKNPIQIGFGVQTSYDFKRAAALAQGVIVGSALLKAIEQGAKRGGHDGKESVAQAAGDFIAGLLER